MNIIYIHTHDTGRYIEPYGYNVNTPNLMQLAKDGVIFRHAYCAAPTCSPSRAALLTGMCPHSNGMLGLTHRGFGLNDNSKHLAHYLSNSNYDTALFGIQHETVHDKTNLGYKTVYNSENKEKDKRDVDNALKSAEYIKQKKDKPFFLSFGMSNTHRKFPKLDDTVNPNYVIPPFLFYDNNNNRTDFAEYMISVKIVDNCVGIILDAIKESGIEDDTFIFFTTDHGIAFPKMKSNLYDTGIGVSLIMKVPGNRMKGKAIDSIVSHIDVFPTICDYLKIPKPEWLQGKSLIPLLNGETDKIRDEIFAEVTFHAAYEPIRCVRTERYKYIKFFDDHEQIVPANTDASLSKTFLVDHGWLETKRAKEMLFDLYLDPVERENRINDKKYKEVYNDLAARLQKWMEDTNDPLLKGKVPKPEGAKINKLTTLDPINSDFEE